MHFLFLHEKVWASTSYFSMKKYGPAHQIFNVTSPMIEQWWLRQACAYARSCQSLRSLHTQSMAVEEGSDRKN